MPSVSRIGKSKAKISRSVTDFYPTRQEFADGHIKALLESVLLPIRTLNTLDVGFGSGIYGQAINGKLHCFLNGIDVDGSNLPTYHPYSNLTIGDFLQHTVSKKYDLIVGNPPYYVIQDFFEHAISLINPDGVVSFLVKAAYLESAIRFEWFKKHRPYSVWQAVNRPINKHAESYVIVNYKKEDWGQPTKFGWLLSNKKEYSFYE